MVGNYGVCNTIYELVYNCSIQIAYAAASLGSTQPGKTRTPG